MGPWFIRDAANPFRPGCSFDTLKDLIARGKIVPETILRGPATRQLWNFAARTPGVANLLGFCHNCRASVRPDAMACPSCRASFAPPVDRQFLGLAPIHLLPGQAPPEVIAEASLPSRPPVSRAAPDPATLAQSITDEPSEPTVKATPEPRPSQSPPIDLPLFPPNSPLISLATTAPSASIEDRPQFSPHAADFQSAERTIEPVQYEPPREEPFSRSERLPRSVPPPASRTPAPVARPHTHTRTLIILGVAGLAALAVGYWTMSHRPAPSSNPPTTATTNHAPTTATQPPAPSPAPSSQPVASPPTSATVPSASQPSSLAPTIESSNTARDLTPAAPASAPTNSDTPTPADAKPALASPWLANLVAILSQSRPDDEQLKRAIAAIPESARVSRTPLESLIASRQRELRARLLP